MGIQHEGSHGRVFRGLDANHLEHKRDFIKWNHAADHMKAAARPADLGQLDLAQKEVAQKDVASVATLTSVVYETLSADFDGPIAGYTTLAQAAPSTTATSAAAATLTNSNEAAYASAKAAASAGVSSGSASASATVTKFSTATLVPTSSQATTAVSTDDDGSGNKSRFLNPPATAVTSASLAVTPTGAAVVAGTPISATHSADSSNTGMTGGAKAGLAFGIILGLALFGGLIFFCLRRRKNNNAHQEITNEKRASNSSSFFGGNAMSEKRVSAASNRSAPSAATAPRLSLRPVTQFLPNLGSNKNATGDHLDASAAMSDKPKSMWERRSQNSQNPFDDNNSMSEKRPESPPSNPFDEPEGEKSAHGHSDSVSELGTAAAVAVAGGAPSPRAQNNVHRVQLDFKPSMDDELELKSGQLVRMLHSYDDGWVS